MISLSRYNPAYMLRLLRVHITYHPEQRVRQLYLLVTMLFLPASLAVQIIGALVQVAREIVEVVVETGVDFKALWVNVDPNKHNAEVFASQLGHAKVAYGVDQ